MATMYSLGRTNVLLQELQALLKEELKRYSLGDTRYPQVEILPSRFNRADVLERFLSSKVDVNIGICASSITTAPYSEQAGNVCTATEAAETADIA